MPYQEVNLGDIVECPHCKKEFEMNNFSDDDLDDFDEYFEHITTCEEWLSPEIRRVRQSLS